MWPCAPAKLPHAHPVTLEKMRDKLMAQDNPTYLVIVYHRHFWFHFSSFF